MAFALGGEDVIANTFRMKTTRKTIYLEEEKLWQ